MADAEGSKALEGVGHNMVWEQTEKIAQEIQGFVEGE